MANIDVDTQAVPARGAMRSRLTAALLTLTVIAFAISPAIATSIQTDLWVYQTGDTVNVTGDGFWADESVELVTTDPYGVEVDRGTTLADGSGNIAYSYVLTATEPGIYDIVATGLTSGLTAATQFDPPNFGVTIAPSGIVPSSVDYSDSVTFSGTVTCINASGPATNKCLSTAYTGVVIDVQLQGGDFASFTTVASLSTSITFTGAVGGGVGCTSICSESWSFGWQANVEPGTYAVRARSSGFTTSSQISAPPIASGLTVTAEGTSTEFSGDTSATEFTSLNLSADANDFDLGSGAGNGMFSPDPNFVSTVAATDGMKYELFPGGSCLGTAVVGPVYDDVDSSGGASGASLSLAAIGQGSYSVKTTYLGNAYYASSGDCDAVEIQSANTPPQLTLPANIVAEAASALGASVPFVVSATDLEDGPLTPTCDYSSGDTFPLGSTEVTCSVTDSGGLSDSGSFFVTVQDTTAPSVLITLDPSDTIGANSWLNIASSGTDGVKVIVTPADAVGIASVDCTDDITGSPLAVSLTAEGDNFYFVIGDGMHGISCTATDTSGNPSTAAVALFMVDQVAPSISAALSPDQPASGWWNIASGAPTVTYTCADGGSGVDTCSPPFTFVEGADQGDTGTAEDVAGNSNTASVSNIDVDLTAPSIGAALTPASPAASGWYNASTGAPSVSFLCSDTLSGLSAACPSAHLFGEGADQFYSETISDNAGNFASAGVTNVDVDTVLPTAAVTGMPSPAVAYLGDPLPTIGCSTADAAPSSGIAAVATPSSTAYLNSNGVGSIVYECGGQEDNAGNAGASAYATLYIQYDPADLSGILQPINPDGTSLFSRGKAVPVKFRMSGDEPSGFDTTGWLIARVQMTCDSAATELTVEAVGSVTPSTTFRYDSAADQYIYNADFRSKPAGTCWMVRVYLDDGVPDLDTANPYDFLVDPTILESARFKLQK